MGRISPRCKPRVAWVGGWCRGAVQVQAGGRCSCRTTGLYRAPGDAPGHPGRSEWAPPGTAPCGTVCECQRVQARQLSTPRHLPALQSPIDKQGAVWGPSTAASVEYASGQLRLDVYNGTGAGRGQDGARARGAVRAGQVVRRSQADLLFLSPVRVCTTAPGPLHVLLQGLWR